MKIWPGFALTLTLALTALSAPASAQYDPYGRPTYPPYGGYDPPPGYYPPGYRPPPPPGYYPPPAGYYRPPPPGYRPPPSPGYGGGSYGRPPAGTSRACVTSRGTCDAGVWLPLTSPCKCSIPGFGRKRGNIM